VKPVYLAIGCITALAITGVLCGIDGTVILSTSAILGGLGGYAFGKWKK